MADSELTYRVTITGVVQGVGFRPFVYNLARRLGVRGWVLNHSGGVDIEAQGSPATLEAFLAALEAEAPPLARIASLDAEPVAPAERYADFEIRRSERQAGQYQLISPDVATCPDCRRELLDPADRRYRYPFINCTNCGPRFTIIEDIPYDRPNTTMRVFPMCEDCRAEYEDPADRRFHAQPNACPVCGPQVWLVEDGVGEGERGRGGQTARRDAALARVRDLLLAGKIVAIKGLGGFHLACDATNAEAVRALRERKRRPHKPFALMVATLADARALCRVPPEAEAQLTSPQCPIVLLDRRPGAPVVDGVAPRVGTLGVMLPYTPLHHVLLRDAGRPLVMTSGNRSEEPIAKDNDEALRRLAPLADAFLLHDRDIHARYDDSVVQVVGAQGRESQIANPESPITNPKSPIPNHPSHSTSDIPHFPLQFLRRARGYAPFPIRLPWSMPQTLAVGPLLKNTFALTRDDYAFVSQHIGDLEDLDTLAHYEATLATYKHLFRLEPERVVCDMHPDYLSTRLAQDYAQEHGLPAPLRVQHHQAHVAACLADNGWTPEDGPVLGVMFDGTGYGEDGTLWGGEWFVGDYGGFRRAAHLEYLPLPGGDAAIRQPWRIAVGYLHALLGPEAFPAGVFCPSEALMVRQQVEHRLNTPLTSSMGRLFDAVSALLDVRQVVSYEAQAAIELEHVATTAQVAPAAYPFDVARQDGVWIVRLAALFDALLADVERALAPAEIALRFHATVAATMTQVCARLREETGLRTVALSGGVFQNRLLLRLAVPQLRAEGFEVLLHRQVPCNDGGLSLGQAAMAGAAHG